MLLYRRVSATGQIVWSSLNLTGSSLADLETRNHNDLQNHQGGTTDEYYHLTAAQHTDLTDAGDSTSHYHASDRSWNNLTGTPTTLAGYGITDAAPAAEGVTNGNSHDHSGGDGAQIDHAGLANLTTGDPHTQYQQESEKDAANGYAGLNASSRTVKGVDTTDDLIVDSTTKGPVLKSPNGHYWRLDVDDSGGIGTTDLGTSKP